MVVVVSFGIVIFVYQCRFIRFIIDNVDSIYMPSVNVNLNPYDLKLIRRLARHEKLTQTAMIRHLVKMSLNVVRIEERTGWCYGPEPKLPRLPADKKKPSRFEGWTKEQRDAWILNGTRPGDDGVTATGA